MVSAEYYVKAFFKGMEQRQKALGNMIALKRKIQREQADPRTEQTITNLINILGQDDRRRDGKIENQSIRHLLSRMIKSAKFLETNRNRIIGQIANTSAEKGFTEMINWLNKSMNDFKVILTKLEANYAAQIAALNQKNLAKCIRLSVTEDKLLVALSDFGQKLAKEAKPKVSKISYILEKNPEEVTIVKGAAVFLIIGTGILGALCGVGWAVAGGIMLTAFTGAVLEVFSTDIKETLNKYQKEVWTT